VIRRLFAAAAAAGPELGRWRAVRRLRDRCAREGVLCLTYDDGPGRRLTPALLDLLAGHSATATFFMLGERATAAPDVVDQLVQAGHEVGCHGYAHLDAYRAPRSAVLRDIDDGYEALAPWVAADGTFRPPYGNRSVASARALRRRGAAVGWWTVDSRDALLAPPAVDDVIRRVDADAGGVVLLHDFDRGEGDRERERFVLDTTDALLDLAARRGWRVVPQNALA
jgi:peptidoglycan/xylan/chitin deacetylase (PgdA/CDA1 family)